MSAHLVDVFVEAEGYALGVVLGQMHEEAIASEVCQYVYDFIDQQQIRAIGPDQKPLQFASLVVMFVHQQIESEEDAAVQLFSLLSNMHQYDRTKGNTWAEGVSADPKSKYFSFSIGGEAFFIPFLYQHSHAPARRSAIPLLVFNSHRMFNELKRRGKFQAAKKVIRQNQLDQFGFVPELLADYGEELEFLQYLLPAVEQTDMAWAVLQRIAGDEPFG